MGSHLELPRGVEAGAHVRPEREHPDGEPLLPPPPLLPLPLLLLPLLLLLLLPWRGIHVQRRHGRPHLDADMLVPQRGELSARHPCVVTFGFYGELEIIRRERSKK